MNDQSKHPSPKRPDLVHLSRFPLPPSANHLYATVGRRRVKSREYKLFYIACQKWMMMNGAKVDEARQLTLETGPRRFIHIDTVFFMHRSRILCKDGTPKKNDTSNRLKALHDVLAQILGLDDSYFFSGSYDKVAVDDESKVGVDITMVVTPYTDRACDSLSW